MRFFTKRWVQVALLLSLLLISVFAEVSDTRVLERVRHMTFDIYNNAMPRPPGDRTIIVDLDEESLRRYGQWPWSRTLVAQIVTNLKEMGAKSITFDIVFAEADRTSPAQVLKNLPDTPATAAIAQALRQLPDNDKIFAKAIADAGNVVTGFVGANQPTGFKPPTIAHFSYRKQALSNLPMLRYFATNLDVLTDAAAGNGAFIMTPDDDGVIRRVPLIVMPAGDDGKLDENQDPLPGLSLEALRVALGGKMIRILDGGSPEYKIKELSIIYNDADGKNTQLRVPVDESGSFLVHYARHRDQLGMYVPAWKILEGKADPAQIKDKIVFLGTSAIGLLDLRSSPLDPILPGVEVHAEIVNQILHGDFLERSDSARGAEGAFTLVAGLVIIFLAPFIGVGTLAFLSLASIGGWAAWGFYAYQHHGSLVDIVFPAFAIVTMFILSSILSNLRTEMEKRMIRQAFDRYLSPALIEELVKDPSRLKLGGDVRELSVMFTDIRNFTTISESMDPAELIRMMNDFLTPMTSAVLDNKGFVDKYMGDAMMTFWNAPVDDAYHAQNACRAALEMVEALKPVNAELKARAEKAGRPFYELKAGIGINSGRASVGNMGSKQRFAYSALGDTVNLASRLEGQTKIYGVTTMIAHSTRVLVPQFAAIELDLLTVKGRTEPERIYTLLGDEATAKKPEFQSFAALHARMLEAYRGQKWAEAVRLSEECAVMKPELAGLYKLYASRIAHYREEPPGPGWTGVWVAKEK
jgi:adenylate cyclase